MPRKSFVSTILSRFLNQASPTTRLDSAPLSLLTSVAAALLIVNSALAQNGYLIRDVAVGNVPNQAPAINNAGAVSFINGGGGVSVWNGTGVSAVPTGGLSGFTSHTDINDSGVVAFTNGFGVYTSSVGGALATVASQNVLPSGTIVDAPAINNNGTVVFTGGTFSFDEGTLQLYQSSGSATPISLATLGTWGLGQEKPQPAINSEGAIVVGAHGINGAQSGVYLANVSGLTPVVTSTSFGDTFGAASINANGQVFVGYSPLFGVGDLLKGTAQPLQVYGSTATSSFATFLYEGVAGGNASINDHGNVAFLADLRPYNASTSGGLFTGLDAVHDKVVMQGDPLDGSTIKELDFGQFGLNNSGQITFWAELNNGQSGIFQASLVPEPSSLILAAIGGLALFLVARRRKAA